MRRNRRHDGEDGREGGEQAIPRNHDAPGTIGNGIVARVASRRSAHATSMRSLYPLFRPLLFAADPELAHDLVLRALDAAARAGLARAEATAPATTPV